MNNMISKSEIADELNVKKKAITYWTEKFIGEVESSQGRDTMYTKEEYEKLVHVYLYRTLNCSCTTISKLLDEKTDNDAIITDQIEKIEESIETQKKWLNILKYSKLTGTQMIDIMNDSKIFGQQSYKNNLILYSYIINHLGIINDESMYNLDVLYDNKKNLNSLIQEIANYAVLLINGYKYDSEELQNQIHQLVNKGSFVFGESILLSTIYAFNQIRTIIKKEENYDEVVNTHNQSIYYYLINNHNRTIIDYIDEINYMNNEIELENKLEELYQYLSTIKILTLKGRIKIIELFNNIINEKGLNAVFIDLIDTDKCKKSLNIIYNFFIKKRLNKLKGYRED